MVSEAHGRVTFTAKEAEVIAMLQRGPADLGPITDRFIKRPIIGQPFELRRVERTVTNRLRRAGYVEIDLGAQVTLTEKARRAIEADR